MNTFRELYPLLIVATAYQLGNQLAGLAYSALSHVVSRGARNGHS